MIDGYIGFGVGRMIDGWFDMDFGCAGLTNITPLDNTITITLHIPYNLRNYKPIMA